MEPPRFIKTTTPLGERQEIFGPWRANVYAGYGIAAIFVVLGLAMLVSGFSQMPVIRRAPNPGVRKETVDDLILGLLGLPCFLVSFTFGYLARIYAGSRMELHEHGFRQWSHGGGGDPILWQDVLRIEEHFVPDSAPDAVGVVGLIVPTTMVRNIAIIHRDGSRFIFDREKVHRLGRLIKRLKAVAELRAIPWVVIEREE